MPDSFYFYFKNKLELFLSIQRRFWFLRCILSDMCIKNKRKTILFCTCLACRIVAKWLHRRVRVVIPTGRYSDSSIFRQVVVPTGRYSDKQVVIPTGLYSDRSIFRQVVIPTGRYSDRSIFRQTGRYSYKSIVRQTGRYSDRSIVRQTDKQGRYSERSIFRQVVIPT